MDVCLLLIASRANGTAVFTSSLKFEKFFLLNYRMKFNANSWEKMKMYHTAEKQELLFFCAFSCNMTKNTFS